MTITLHAARALRDGGIDAVAALNAALVDVLANLPADQHEKAKREVGRAMAAVLERTVEPAVNAYPELEPDESTWAEVARTKAAMRAGK